MGVPFGSQGSRGIKPCCRDTKKMWVSQVIIDNIGKNVPQGQAKLHIAAHPGQAWLQLHLVPVGPKADLRSNLYPRKTILGVKSRERTRGRGIQGESQETRLYQFADHPTEIQYNGSRNGLPITPKDPAITD